MFLSDPAILLAGWSLIGLATILIFWALFGDRLRGGRRRRCPRCWYDMSSVPGPTCPECGRTAARESSLFRTRRHWRWTAFGILVLALGIAGACVHPISRIDWIARTPSSALLRMVKDPSPPRESDLRTPRDVRIVTEIWRRYAAGTLPMSCRKSLTSLTLGPATPPVLLTTRPVWPAGVPILVHASITRSAIGPVPRDITVNPALPGAHAMCLYEPGLDLLEARARGGGWIGWSAPPPTLSYIGTPSPDATSVSFNISIDEGRERLWSGSVAMPIKIAGGIADVVTPDSSPTITDHLRTWARTGLILSPDASAFSFTNPSEDLPASATVLSLHIAILYEGSRCAEAKLLWTPSNAKRIFVFSHSSGNEEGSKFVGEIAVDGDIARMAAADLSDSRWQVRITGDPVLALRDFQASIYWQGTIEVPLSVVKR